MKYIKATVTTTDEFADTLSVIMIDMGSEGVSVTDFEDVKRVLAEHNWDYADESLFDGYDSCAYVSGYYPEGYDFAPLAEKLNGLRISETNAGSLELGLCEIDSADYENEWKKYYSPIELDKLTVVPEWMSSDSEKVHVLIDPGMAFGTGSHETTRLCLGFLEMRDVSDKYVADVGCGSGILGAAALKLGAKYCLMTDIDPQAIEATRHNCAINGVENRADIRLGTLNADYENKFSLILANITADVLISLYDTFVNSLSDGGVLIMSGIIHSRADDVVKAYDAGFLKVDCKADGEWLGFVWEKKVG